MAYDHLKYLTYQKKKQLKKEEKQEIKKARETCVHTNSIEKYQSQNKNRVHVRSS